MIQKKVLYKKTAQRLNIDEKVVTLVMENLFCGIRDEFKTLENTTYAYFSFREFITIHGNLTAVKRKIYVLILLLKKYKKENIEPPKNVIKNFRFYWKLKQKLNLYKTVHNETKRWKENDERHFAPR